VAGEDKATYLARKRAYWQRLLNDLAQAPCANVMATDTILDMGCGPSGIYMMYEHNKIIAVDPLIDRYEQDLAVFSKTDYPNVRFVRSTIEEYTDTATYDFIFCMNAINHVSDIQAGFRKLAELAHKGTTLVITIDAHNNGLMKAIFRIGPGDVLHPHQYDLAEYTEFVKSAGFRIKAAIRLKKEAIFSHYMLVAERL